MDTPYFSIIIPVFNVESYLEKCVQSVLEQTFTNFEIILVDDGSTDLSGRVCDTLAQYYSQIKVIHKENCGQSDARNVGIRLAVGYILLFLDSDDYYGSTSFLQCVYNSFVNNDNDVVLCGCVVRDLITGYERISRGNYAQEVFNTKDKNIIMNYLYHNGLFPGSAWVIAVKRSLIEKIQLSFPIGITAEDYYWVSNILHVAERIGASDNAYYVYNVNRAGSTTTRPRVSGIKGVVFAIDDWMMKIHREQGISNFLARTYLLAIMNYSQLDSDEKKNVKYELERTSSILKEASVIQFRMAAVILRLIGLDFMGLIVEKVYHKLSKR